jgi:hypothetical protein
MLPRPLTGNHYHDSYEGWQSVIHVSLPRKFVENTYKRALFPCLILCHWPCDRKVGIYFVEKMGSIGKMGSIEEMGSIASGVSKH